MIFSFYFILLIFKFQFQTIKLETNKDHIAEWGVLRQQENEAFRNYLRNRDSDGIDSLVSTLYPDIEKNVDCTQCGACCRSLMINVTQEESHKVAGHLNMSGVEFEKMYIEKSLQGQMIMNTIPCHFLSDSKCTIYDQRFNECREFPHLHKPNFNDRLFGTLIHYSICPIIFNVIEQLKIATDFFQDKHEQ